MLRRLAASAVRLPAVAARGLALGAFARRALARARAQPRAETQHSGATARIVRRFGSERAAPSSGVVLALGLAAGTATGFAGAYAANLSSAPSGSTQTVTQLGPYFIADVAAATAPSVVRLSVREEQPLRARRQMILRPTESGGSGFVIDAEGTIITNAHVISSFEHPQVVVHSSDGREYVAHIENMDARSDVAVLRVQGHLGVPPLPLGDSDSLRPGEWVVAIGSPLNLHNSITCGIVSALHRQSTELGLENNMDYIQSDASITIGNSGGPLVNLDGKVIGINTIAAMGSSISFAIPINRAKEVVAQMRQYGRVLRPAIGVKLLTITPDMKPSLFDSSSEIGIQHGALVFQVVPGSPADKAGLRQGDVIVSVDGRAVVEANEVVASVRSVGQTLKLRVVRENTVVTIPVQAGDEA